MAPPAPHLSRLVEHQQVLQGEVVTIIHDTTMRMLNQTCVVVRPGSEYMKMGARGEAATSPSIAGCPPHSNSCLLLRGRLWLPSTRISASSGNIGSPG